jgi:hypothetical protein
MFLWNKNINHEKKIIFYHYVNSWFFQLGSLVKKYPNVTSVKKTTLSIWTNHFDHVLGDSKWLTKWLIIQLEDNGPFDWVNFMLKLKLIGR